MRAWVVEDLAVDAAGRVTVGEPAASTLQYANSETGLVQDLPEGLAVSDWTQAFGKMPVAFDWSGVEMAFVSATRSAGRRESGH